MAHFDVILWDYDQISSIFLTLEKAYLVDCLVQCILDQFLSNLCDLRRTWGFVYLPVHIYVYLFHVAGGEDSLVNLCFCQFVCPRPPDQNENDSDLQKQVVSRLFSRISLITFKKSKFHNFLLANRVVVISSFYKMNNNVRN